MKIGAQFRLVAFTAAILFSSSAWGQEDTPAGEEADARPPNVAAAVEQARTLVDQGRFAEALGVLQSLQVGRDGGPEMVFLVGLAATGAALDPRLAADDRDGLLDLAIAAFRTLLADAPGLVRVRLELARAFFLKGEDDLARGHFELVLAGNPPEPVAENVNRFLQQIRARKRWSIFAGFALAPDTNIGATSAERIIYIGGLPFQRDQEELTTSGVGLSVWTNGEYQAPLSAGTRLRAGAYASRRDYAGSLFDRMFVALHAGPRWLVNPATEASLLASAQRSWLGNAPDFDAPGVRLEVDRRLTPRTRGAFRVSAHDRKYRSRSFLDGSTLDASLDGSWVAAPTIRVNFGLGVGRDRPETERWRHERRWVRAGADFALPRAFNLGVSVEQRWSDYEGNWFPFTITGEPREDRTRSVRLFLYNGRLTWRGFSPQLTVVHEVRDTNAQGYDYKRTGGELRAVRLF